MTVLSAAITLEWMFTLGCESGVVRKEMGETETEIEGPEGKPKGEMISHWRWTRIMICPRQWKRKGTSKLLSPRHSCAVFVFPCLTRSFSSLIHICFFPLNSHSRFELVFL